MFSILAQSSGGDVSGLAGASGWAGAGLLGLVLAWLMLVHIPAVLKAHTDAMATKDGLITKLVDNFRDEMHKERETHLLASKAQREDYAATSARLGDLLLANTSEMRLLSASVTNLAQQAGLTIPPHKQA